MSFKVPTNSTLRRELGEAGVDFLEHGIEGLERVLPHVDTGNWRIEKGAASVAVTFSDSTRRELRVVLGMDLDGTAYSIYGTIQRRKIASGVGSISRTISLREQDIAKRIMTAIASTLGPANAESAGSLTALRAGIDERAIAEHLANYHGLDIDLAEWFTTLRGLAEQTYENKAVAFGCLIETENETLPQHGATFPRDFLSRKRYRALSDGYRSAYRVSGRGALLGFVEIGGRKLPPDRFYPEWCEDLAAEARHGRIGIALTRHGDIIIMDDGHLTFTYRFGRWQYWNHGHVVDLILNAARVQHVPPVLLGTVVRSIYRAALDVSFRRSGGLFVLLRNRQKLHHVVRAGEGIYDTGRDTLDATFDTALGPRKAQSLPRCLLTELAGLDGAVVLSNKGDLLAVGAILEPRRKGKVTGAEGSRTKAAIGASNYGLAIKISSDGDITVYVAGTKLITM